MTAAPARREFLISRAWIQAVVLVVLVGFFVLGLLAYRTTQAHPPVPARVVGPTGDVLFTASDVSKGQQVFLHNWLMEYGSVFGHGAYLGPDYTADYLRRSSDVVGQAYGGVRSDSAVQRTIDDMRANRYDADTGTLRFSGPQAVAFRRLVAHSQRARRSATPAASSTGVPTPIPGGRSSGRWTPGRTRRRGGSTA